MPTVTAAQPSSHQFDASLFTTGSSYAFRVGVTDADGNVTYSDWSPMLTMVTGGGSATSITDLLDVNASMTPTAGEALVWDGTEWTADAVTALVSNGTTLDLGTGKILYSNVYPTLADLPDAASYHGMFAHVHAEGAAYYAHNGNWVQLAHDSAVPSTYVSALNGLSGSVILAGGNNVQIGQSGNQLTISSTQTFTTLNGESGSLSLVGGNGIGVSTVDNIITVSTTNHTVVNNLAGNVDIVAGSNINVTTNGQNVVISGQSGGIAWGNPPALPGDPGDPGDMAYDDNWLYVRTSQGWRRSALGTWNPTITITLQPQDLTLQYGGSGNFTVAATVSDGSAPEYQWQNSDDNGSTWDTITGANTTTYSLSGVSTTDGGTKYRAVVSAQGATTVPSNVATLTVLNTFRLLSENGDRVLSEAGDFIDTSAATYSNSTWVQQGSDVDGVSAGDETSPVALSSDGTVLVVGDAGNNSLRVFSDDGTAWVQATLPSFTALSGRGDFVDIDNSGTAVITGSNTTSSTDGILILTESAGTWSVTELDRRNEGGDVAISGDGTVAAYGWPDNTLSCIEMFNVSSNTTIGSAISRSEYYYSVGTTHYTVRPLEGLSVALNSDGSVVAFSRVWPSSQSILLGPSPTYPVYSGSWAHDGGTAYEAKDVVAVAYQWTGTSWVPMGGELSGTNYLDSFGKSVALSGSGSRIAVGAPNGDAGGTDRGYVRILDWNGSEWVQLGTDITGTNDYDYAGWSVDISTDGSRVVVGLRGADGNGSNSGTSRIYQWSGAAWEQVGNDINGPATNDYSGTNAAISGDGTRVGIGAPGNDDGGADAGQVRVFGEIVAIS